MNRVNLKELRDALNKLPEDKLENIYFMQQLCIDDPSETIGLVWTAEEDEWQTYADLLNTKPGKILNRFSESIRKDHNNLLLLSLPNTNGKYDKLAKKMEEELF